MVLNLLSSYLSFLNAAGIASNAPSELASKTIFNDRISFVITNPCGNLDGDSIIVLIFGA